MSVIVGGVGHLAILENNAFYYELSPGVHSGDVQEVIATWKDGSVHQFPVHR